MKCPACGAEGPEGALECASCGVIFAKFQEKRKRERDEAEQALARMNVPPAATVDPHLGRRIAAILVAGWAALMGLFVLKEMQRRRERAAAAAERIPASYSPPGVGAPVPPGAPPVPAHAVIAEPSGQFSSPSGESVSSRPR